MNAAVEPEQGNGTSQVPADRYGRTADARADRILKIVGGVLGALLLVVVGWFGWHYVAGTEISAEVITFDAVSDHAVQVHLEVRKDAGARGYCTLRSRSADGTEVGRADFRFDQHEGRIDKVLTLRTTARGTSAELIGCHTG